MTLSDSVILVDSDFLRRHTHAWGSANVSGIPPWLLYLDLGDGMLSLAHALSPLRLILVLSGEPNVLMTDVGQILKRGTVD